MLEEFAVKVGAAAKLMNLFLDESDTGCITDVFIEQEAENVLVRFAHERGEDITFHIHPDVFGMAEAVELADIFLRAAYGIGFQLEEEIDPTLN